MSTTTAHKPIVHFVGSIPLPDTELVFRTLAAATGPHLKRLPDGEPVSADLDPFFAAGAGRQSGDRGRERCAAIQIYPVGWQGSA